MCLKHHSTSSQTHQGLKLTHSQSSTTQSNINMQINQFCMPSKTLGKTHSQNQQILTIVFQ